MTVHGVDISKWQDAPSTPIHPDFKKMKAAGAEFVICKASQATFTDPEYLEYMKNAKAAGMIRGAYHYLDGTKSGVEQANYFCSLIANDMPDLPPIVDYEESKNVPSGDITRLKDFCEVVKAKTKRTPIIYTGFGYWVPYGSTDPYWLQYDLWVANWYVITPKIPAPWTSYKLWQYSAKGDGLAFGVESLQIDLDVFNGTLDQLKAYCNIIPPVPAIDLLTSRVEKLETSISSLKSTDLALQKEIDAIVGWKSTPLI